MFLEEGRAGEITNAILFMIAKDDMPFQTVDYEGFRNLVKNYCASLFYTWKKVDHKKWKKNMSI